MVYGLKPINDFEWTGKGYGPELDTFFPFLIAPLLLEACTTDLGHITKPKLLILIERRPLR